MLLLARRPPSAEARSAQATTRPWRGPPAPTAQARAGSVPLSLTPRAVALSATARLPRMLGLCRADESVVLPLLLRPTLPAAQQSAQLVVWGVHEQPRGRPRILAALCGAWREQLRSLACCVVIIYHGHWTPAHGLSPCEWTTARSAHRSGISACAWVPQPPFAAVSGGRECVSSRVHRTAVWQFGALSDC